MTSERRDADRDDEGGEDTVTGVIAELAEAEAAEVDARAEAERARARAVGLRDAEADLAPDEPEAEPDSEEPPHRRVPAMWLTAGLALAALLTAAGLTLTGLMLWQHGQVVAQRAQDRRFVDAAREGVTALLSIDHNSAKADVQRVLDLSAGQFRDDFQSSADDFVKTAVESKAVTTGSISAAALDSINGDRAVVLVAATSQVSNVNGADQDPRPFRISVTVTRDGDTCKMSDVEFVP